MPVTRPSSGADVRLLPGPLFTLFVLLHGHVAAFRTHHPLTPSVSELPAWFG